MVHRGGELSSAMLDRVVPTGKITALVLAMHLKTKVLLEGKMITHMQLRQI